MSHPKAHLAVNSPARILAGLLAFLCLLFILLGLFLYPATQSDFLFSLMDQNQAELSKEDTQKIAASISIYLQGSLSSPQETVSLNGKPQLAFNERELLHLRDVRGLFSLANGLFWLAVYGGLCGLVLLFRNSDGKGSSMLKKAASFVLYASLGMIILVLLMIFLVRGNFALSFERMHQLLFTNDLWLLNPRTDLLIRLMPQTFFEQYALEALKAPIILLFAFLLFAILVSGFKPAGKNKAQKILVGEKSCRIKA